MAKGIFVHIFFLFSIYIFVLLWFALFCFVLFCFVLLFFVLFCFVLFCFVLFCFFYHEYASTRIDIFTFHTRNAKGLTENSGAEWWTLVLDPLDAEVGFHWDKDYTVESDCGVNVFPHVSTLCCCSSFFFYSRHVSTVTYLSSIGAPTLIMNKTAPVQHDDKVTGTADVVCISKPLDCKRIIHHSSS